MATTLGTIDRESLWQKLESGEEVVLVDALSPTSYASSRLPGAVNMPPEWVDERARRRIPDLDSEVIVYCASSTCETSAIVATRLVELGYRNVRRYVEGKRDWVEARLPVERGRP